MSCSRSSVLALVACIMPAWPQVQFSPYSKEPPKHTAAEVLESAIRALDGVKSMEYEVRMLRSGPGKSGDVLGDVLYAGRTTIIGTVGSPIRYRAEFRAEEPRTAVLAVSNGDVVRFSEGGKIQQQLTRTMEDSASTAALPTLQLFDASRYREALAAKNAVYAGQDDIEGDLCYVVAVPALMKNEIGSDTFYYWISARTGLPRGRQMFRIINGRTVTSPRWIVSSIRLNPEIPEDTFRYRPTESDSTPSPGLPEYSSQVDAGALIGKRMPDLESRDAEYKPVLLSKAVNGKATIISLWASWCGPCIAEFPAFQKLLDRYPGKLQIITLAVNDSRIAVLNFINKHPEYKFTNLTDPYLEDRNSKIAQFFLGEGVPRNVFVAEDGRITDYVPSSYAGREEELFKKVEQWLK